MEKKNLSKEALALASAMAAKGMTNAQVADYMDVSPGFVSQWLTDNRKVPWEKAERLAALLGVQPKQISAKYAQLAAARVAAGNVVQLPVKDGEPSGMRQDLVISRLQNDVDSLRYALSALVAVMASHRPAEGADVARTIRKHVPAKFVNQGFVLELLKALDKGA